MDKNKISPQRHKDTKENWIKKIKTLTADVADNADLQVKMNGALLNILKFLLCVLISVISEICGQCLFKMNQEKIFLCASVPLW
jgi:hypothetical protein